MHSAIERGVTDRLGDVGARLHAGRSRNDLVVTDLRLWMLAAGRRIEGLVTMLVRTLVARAREHAETVMPGTTHARAAQPVTLGHHLLAHAWALLRDLERFDQAAVRTSVSPLGAGRARHVDPRARSRAGRRPSSGSGARSTTRSTPSRTATSSRSSWPTPRSARPTSPVWRPISPAGPIRRSDGRSSTRPTRPGPASCRRSGTRTRPSWRARRRPRIAGGFVALTSVLQGLPLGYHRDLQEDKEPAFDAADTLELVLPALVGAVDSMRFDVAAMRAAARRRGALRHRPRRGARARRRAVPRGASADRSAAEGARRARSATLRDLTAGGVGGVRRRRTGQRCSTRTPRSAPRTMPGGPSPASVTAQAEAVSAALAARAGRA